MVLVGVLEARNNLSKLVRDVESGVESMVVIQRNGVPVAKIVPFDEPCAESRRLGVAKDRVMCRDGWDSDELNAEIASLFERCR